MNLKRNNWTNDEVITLLKSRKVENCPDLNEVVDLCIDLFEDMKEENLCYHSAKALDLDTGLIYCVGPKLPQQ